jgi:hypothetical protein
MIPVTHYAEVPLSFNTHQTKKARKKKAMRKVIKKASQVIAT